MCKVGGKGSHNDKMVQKNTLAFILNLRTWDLGTFYVRVLSVRLSGVNLLLRFEVLNIIRSNRVTEEYYKDEYYKLELTKFLFVVIRWRWSSNFKTLQIEFFVSFLSSTQNE